jgi:hypothetical protein
MKLVIWTQYLENYAFDENGAPKTGAEAFWKHKGGDIFIIPNFTIEQALAIGNGSSKILDELYQLIEEKNDFAQTYVTDWGILDDDTVTHESWEAPYILSQVDGKWICTQVQNGKDWGFHHMVESCTKTFIMAPNGERRDFQATYTLYDGRTMDWKETEIAIKSVA